MKFGVKVAGWLLLCPALAAAQMRGVPASVTSPGAGVRFSQSPGIPASVTSFGPNGFVNGFGSCFGCFGGFRGGFSFGHFRSGRFRFNNFGFNNGFNNFGFFPHRGVFPFGGVPVVVPIYSYPYSYPYPYSEPYEPYTVEQPVVVERRVIREEVIDDSRYGDHYLDRREDRGRSRDQEDSQPAIIEAKPGASTREQARRPQPEPVEQAPATVLVFKDGHKLEIHNYAVVGNTLWDLREHTAKKIPLGDLDLDATIKLNDERGIPFKLPRRSL